MPLSLSLEELSKLWSVFFQTAYTLSMAYLATTVLIEPTLSFQQPLPVRVRNITAFPFQRTIVDKVVSAAGDDEPVAMNDTIAIKGQNLAGPVSTIHVGEAELAPVPANIGNTQISLALTSATLRAGVQGVQVVYSNGAESNVAPLVLRPRITVDAPNVTDEEVPLDFQPSVGRRRPRHALLKRVWCAARPATSGLQFPCAVQQRDRRSNRGKHDLDRLRDQRC